MKDQSYFEITKEQQKVIQERALSGPEPKEKWADLLTEKTHNHASRFLDEVGSKFDTACKKGCSYCCYQPATVFAFEAIRIAEVLQKNLSAQQLSELKEAMQTRVKGLTGASVQKSINNKTACPLLVNDKCSVYEDRPLTCRMANSFSVKRCRLAFEKSRFKVQIPISLEIQSGVGGIINAVFEGLPNHGLDGNLYELCSAVLLAFSDQEIATKWGDGDLSAFHECIKDDT